MHAKNDVRQPNKEANTTLQSVLHVRHAITVRRKIVHIATESTALEFLMSR